MRFLRIKNKYRSFNSHEDCNKMSNLCLKALIFFWQRESVTKVKRFFKGLSEIQVTKFCCLFLNSIKSFSHHISCSKHFSMCSSACQTLLLFQYSLTNLQQVFSHFQWKSEWKFEEFSSWRNSWVISGESSTRRLHFDSRKKSSRLKTGFEAHLTKIKFTFRWNQARIKSKKFVEKRFF